MKILVTGGLGFIGSHTVVELQNQGFEVVAIDNLSNSSIEVLEGIERITDKKPIFGNIDLREKSSVQNFFKKYQDIVGVIHFAASKAVGESVENPLLYYENNINTLVYVLQELTKLPQANFIFSSSCTVYGQAEKNAYNRECICSTRYFTLWKYKANWGRNHSRCCQSNQCQLHFITLF